MERVERDIGTLWVYSRVLLEKKPYKQRTIMFLISEKPKKLSPRALSLPQTCIAHPTMSTTSLVLFLLCVVMFLPTVNTRNVGKRPNRMPTELKSSILLFKDAGSHSVPQRSKTCNVGTDSICGCICHQSLLENDAKNRYNFHTIKIPN